MSPRQKRPGEEASSASRRLLIAVLVTVATASCSLVSFSGLDTEARVLAAIVAFGAGIGSLVLVRKRSALGGWYAIAIGIALVRLVSQGVQ